MELKVMVPESLFLVALREYNPKLWKWSFPFHFGLYLVGATTMLLIFGGLVSAFAPASVSTTAAVSRTSCGPTSSSPNARWRAGRSLAN